MDILNNFIYHWHYNPCNDENQRHEYFQNRIIIRPTFILDDDLNYKMTKIINVQNYYIILILTQQSFCESNQSLGDLLMTIAHVVVRDDDHNHRRRHPHPHPHPRPRKGGGRGPRPRDVHRCDSASRCPSSLSLFSPPYSYLKSTMGSRCGAGVERCAMA